MEKEKSIIYRTPVVDVLALYILIGVVAGGLFFILKALPAPVFVLVIFVVLVVFSGLACIPLVRGKVYIDTHGIIHWIPFNKWSAEWHEIDGWSRIKVFRAQSGTTGSWIDRIFVRRTNGRIHGFHEGVICGSRIDVVCEVLAKACGEPKKGKEAVVPPRIRDGHWTEV